MSRASSPGSHGSQEFYQSQPYPQSPLSLGSQEREEMRRVLFAEGSQENVSSNTGVVSISFFQSLFVDGDN
jgi:hypothetical protein